MGPKENEAFLAHANFNSCILILELIYLDFESYFYYSGHHEPATSDSYSIVF